MLHSAGSNLGIQKEYFTKEFSEYEIESKWVLLTQNPVSALLMFMKDIAMGLWSPYAIQRCMGKLPIGVRFFSVDFIFFGNYDNDVWHEIAKAAVSPWQTDRYLLAFKGKEEYFNFVADMHYPLKRKEQRSGDWIDYDTMMNQIKFVAPDVATVGKIKRERCSIYITNPFSFRNFCLSADKCVFQESILSQVEVEYKGRNGIWLNNASEAAILREFQILHSILEKYYSDILLPTTYRKFQWIVECTNV